MEGEQSCDNRIARIKETEKENRIKQLKEDIETATYLVYRQAPQLPNARVFGPLPRVDGQSAVVAVAELAVETAKNGSLTGAHFLIQTAYRDFANLAERETAAATDKPLKRWGMRGRGLTCAVESIMWPKASSNAGKDVYSGWIAVLNYVKELVLETAKSKGVMKPGSNCADQLRGAPRSKRVV